MGCEKNKRERERERESKLTSKGVFWLLAILVAVIAAFLLVMNARAVGPYLMISTTRCGEYRQGATNDLTEFEKKDCDDVMDGNVTNYITGESCGNFLSDENAATTLDASQKAACRQWAEFVKSGEAGIAGEPKADGEYCQTGYVGVYTSDMLRKCEQAKSDVKYTYEQCLSFRSNAWLGDGAKKDYCEPLLASPTYMDCFNYWNGSHDNPNVSKTDPCWNILRLDEAPDTPTTPTGNPCKETNIIKVDCGKKGEGIWGILRLVLQILTWGVGILGVLGIVIASIVYTTAGGD
ncbi:MAG: hypothetical protein LBM97_00440, partial [Candidatus Nomurabacteria bacterium]|nr:hypothetical protein [Candidatus Nomurabacteria bacterium]